MGVDNYFLKVLTEGMEPGKTILGHNHNYGKSSIEESEFRKALFATSSNVKFLGSENKTSKKYLIEKSIVLTVDLDGEYMNDIYFEGSMSWFEESFEIIYDLCYQIVKNGLPLKLYYPTSDCFFDLSSKSEFIAKVKSIYRDKVDAYNKVFGQYHENVSPRGFYSAYRRKMFFSNLLNLFGVRK